MAKAKFVDVDVCGVICSCDGPTAIHRWAKLRTAWLIQRLALTNGVPSRDCIRLVLIAIASESFQRLFF